MSLSIDILSKKSHSKDFLDESIVNINQELDFHGLPKYKYPLNELPKDIQFPWICWSSSDFSNLQYFAVKVKEKLKLEYDDVFDDRDIKFELMKEHWKKNQSHLICHSTYIGFYVPLDFKGATLPDGFLETIGSSISLRNELIEISDHINFDLGEYTPDLEVLYERRRVELEEDPLRYEKSLVLSMYNMTLASINYNLIIGFG
jgi:hypothetical protein